MLAVFFNVHFIVLWRQGFSLAWSSPRSLGCLARKPRGLRCLSLSAGITGGCCCIQLLTRVQGLTQALTLVWQCSLPMEPSSWPRAG